MNLKNDTQQDDRLVSIFPSGKDNAFQSEHKGQAKTCRAFRMMLLKICLLLSQVFLGQASLARDGRPVVLEPESLKKGFSLDKHVEYFVDESRQISSDNILTSSQVQFISSHRNLQFSYTGGHVWLRLTLENPSAHPYTLELNQQFAMLDYLSIYELQDQRLQVLAEAGDILPPYPRRSESRLISFQLEVPAHSSQTYYLKAFSSSALALPLTLWDARSYRAYMSFDNTVMGVFFGVLVGLLFYNLLLLLTTQLSRAYILYVGLMVCNIFFYLAWTGVGTQYVWSQSQFLIQRGFPLFGNLVCVFILAFQIVFLDLQRNLPGAYKLYLVLIGLCATIAIAVILGMPVPIMQKLTTLGAGGLTAALSSAVGIILMLRGNRQALFFTVAYAFFLISVLMGAMLAGGFVDLPMSLSTYGAQVGSAMECILLAIGLSDRINELHRKTRDAQEQALRLQQDLVQEKEASAKIQRLESELRFKLASSIAHRINNPLNYIQYSIAAIGSAHHELKRGIIQLLGQEPSDDPEMLACQQRFTKLLAEFEGPIADIRQAMSQTEDFVQEIRALSGVDGGSIELLKLEDFWLQSCNKIFEIWPVGVKNRIVCNLVGAESQAIFSNPHILRRALDVLFSVALECSKDQLKCEFRVKSAQEWVLGICGNFAWDKSMSLALERCLNHILSNCGTSCTCTFELHELLVYCYFSDQRASHAEQELLMNQGFKQSQSYAS